MAGFAARPPEDLDIRHRSVNGDSSVVIYAGDSPYGVMVMDLTPDGEQVSDAPGFLSDRSTCVIFS